VIVAAAGAYALAPRLVLLSRSGGDFDQVYGGIGHYLVELEQRRQLAAITRRTPQPIDRTTQPAFRPVIAPALPDARAIDLQVLEARAARERQAAEAARVMRRRQEVEILLLAS
jgi:hypothetical protein